MRTLLAICSLVFALTAYTAVAEEYDVAPADIVCVASGTVTAYVDPFHNTVYGSIGATKFQLGLAKEVIYGDFEGLPVNIALSSRTVTGTIGINQVHWNYVKGGYIRGYETCVRKVTPIKN